MNDDAAQIGWANIGDWLHSYLDMVAHDTDDELRPSFVAARDWVAAKIADEEAATVAAVSVAADVGSATLPLPF